VNEIATRSQPRQAAIGELGDKVAIDNVTAALAAIGIDADRIYYLVGQDGATARNDTRGFLSVFDDVIDEPLSALRSGKTLVAIFGVDNDAATSVRQCLIDAGVTRTHYFGKWTYA
jgi:hypothetical protein